MNKKDLETFVCPTCRGELRLEGASDEVLQQGQLRCGKCDETFLIKGGIPRFVSADNYATTFGFQWNTHRETQLDSHTGIPVSRNRVFSVTGWPEDMRGQTILEAGSGAGRFTEILAGTGADLYSFDYSTACEANLENNGRFDNLRLFQGDIFHIPFAEGSFDKVFCLGVIQHTPDPERAFASLARMVRPGGELVIDVYANTLLARMQWYYLLRPITRRMDKDRLYKIISRWAPRLIPLSRFLRKIAGRAGARLVPIVEFSYLGLPPELNREWAILDTFDQYSPAHDHPQSEASIRHWYEAAGFESVEVGRGPNGVVGKGVKI